MVGQVTHTPEHWDSMLTQGALRQRRRRALESVEERRERLARDAERKRIKRMRESAEEAAWRRTVDAMRKKEKRMKEKIEKLEGRYATNNAGKLELDFEGDDPVLSYARSYSRRRRMRRAEMSDLLLFPDNSDVSDFVDGSRGYDLHNSLLEARLRGEPDSTMPGPSSCCHESVDADRGTFDFGCSLSNNSSCLRNQLMPGTLPGASRGRLKGCHGTLSYRTRTVPPGVTIQKVDSSPSHLRVESDFIPEQLDENLSALSPEVIISELKLENVEEEDDISVSNGLSVLSPEVLIREVKSESLDDEEFMDMGHSQHISALSPEVIISEVKPPVVEGSEGHGNLGNSQTCSTAHTMTTLDVKSTAGGILS